jgi:hypothetical protein
MTEPTSPRKMRFRVSDRVRVVGPSVRPRKEDSGTVTEIISSTENPIYRYRVTFRDGSSEIFFGFELESLES